MLRKREKSVKLIFFPLISCSNQPNPKTHDKRISVTSKFQMMVRVLLHGYFTTKSVFVSTWLETTTFTSRTLDSSDSLQDCLSSTSSAFGSWLAMSSQECAGASSRSLHNQTGEWSREENQPCHSLQGPFWVLDTRREPLRQLRGAQNCIHHPPILRWMDNDPPCVPFPSSAGWKQSKAWGHSHRRWWLRVWRQISLLRLSFRTWAFPVKPDTME